LECAQLNTNAPSDAIADCPRRRLAGLAPNLPNAFNQAEIHDAMLHRRPITGQSIIRDFGPQFAAFASRGADWSKYEQTGRDYCRLYAGSYSFGLSALGPGASTAHLPAKDSHPRKARREPVGGLSLPNLSLFRKATL